MPTAANSLLVALLCLASSSAGAVETAYAPLQEAAQAAAAIAQQARDDSSFDVDVDRVGIFVTVANTTGKKLSFGPKNFRVKEDGVPQKVLRATELQQPATLGLLVDNSKSMRQVRRSVIEAIKFFVKTKLKDDEIFPVSFNDKITAPEVDKDDPFVTTEDQLADFLQRTMAQGSTKLFDAVWAGADYAVTHTQGKGHPLKKVLLIISDGEDNDSKTKLDEALRHAQKAGVSIYALGLPNQDSPDRKKGEENLKRLARDTGGDAVFAKKYEEVPAKCEEIAAAMRNQYLITYVSTNPRKDGSYRTVEVEAFNNNGAKFAARYLPGYTAPNEGESQ